MSSIKIKKDTSLRKAILQAAITGKLISDVEGETETGKQLLDRIIEERKNKLSHGLDFANAKSGKRKSKKETALAGSNPCDIPEDEIPFEIPENWCWCRLGDLFSVGTGLTPLKSNTQFYENGKIPWVTSSLTSQRYITYTEEFVTEKAVEETKLKIYPPNTLIVAMYGQGKTRGQVSKLQINATTNQACAALECYIQESNLIDFAYFFFENNYEKLRSVAEGTSQPNLNLDKIKNTIFPLPPLAVQNAIVEKLEEVLPLVDAYENAVLQKEELKSTLPDSLKKAILQEAIQGKLTESWRIEMLKQVQHDGRTEETGKQLLDRIIEERKKMSHGLDFANAKSGKRKSKKETALAGSNPCDIPEDEIPFEIPESWCWCRLGDVVYKLTDGTHRTPKYVEKGIPFLSVKNLSSGKMDFENTKFITLEEHKELYARCNPEKGDMLLTKVGTTGIPVINDSDIEFSLFVSVALIKYPHHFIDEKYFLYLLQSPLVQEQAKENTRGVGNKNWVMDAIANTLLVLPPLAEQKKIVEILEQMLPLCEKLGG